MATANPVMEIVQTQLEASRQLADAVFAGTEKLDRMMFDATHRAFNQQIRLTQAAIAARDPQELARLQSGLLSRPEEISNYQKEMMAVFTQMQSEIGESMQQYVQQMTAHAGAAGQSAAGAASGAAAGDGTTLNPVAGMISVWQSAFREVAAMANRNMETARSNLAQTMATARATVADAAAAANDSEQGARSAGGTRRGK